MKKVILICVMSILFVSILISRDYTTSGMFLTIPVGARASGLGGAYTALADGALSMYWNPAGLNKSSNEAIFTHNSYIEDLKQDYLGYCRYIKELRGAIGVSVNIFDNGDFERTYLTSGSTYTGKGTFNAKDYALSISYAPELNEYLSFGLSVNYINSKIDDAKAKAVSLDFGWLYKEKDNKSNPFKAGLTIKNIGTKLKYDIEEEELPLSIKLGLAKEIELTDKIKITSAFDNIYEFYIKENYYELGVELNYMNTYFLRSGYDSYNEIENGLTLGCGIKFNKISIDYSYSNYGDLSDAHKFTLGYKF